MRSTPHAARLDLEIGLGVQSLSTDYMEMPQMENWTVRLQSLARGYLARMAFRKRAEAQATADATRTEIEGKDDGEVPDVLCSNARVTQAECLAV